MPNAGFTLQAWAARERRRSGAYAEQERRRSGAYAEQEQRAPIALSHRQRLQRAAETASSVQNGQIRI